MFCLIFQKLDGEPGWDRTNDHLIKSLKTTRFNTLHTIARKRHKYLKIVGFLALSCCTPLQSKSGCGCNPVTQPGTI
jgi:hypothetical protein